MSVNGTPSRREIMHDRRQNKIAFQSKADHPQAEYIDTVFAFVTLTLT